DEDDMHTWHAGTALDPPEEATRQRAITAHGIEKARCTHLLCEPATKHGEHVSAHKQCLEERPADVFGDFRRRADDIPDLGHVREEHLHGVGDRYEEDPRADDDDDDGARYVLLRPDRFLRHRGYCVKAEK